MRIREEWKCPFNLIIINSNVLNITVFLMITPRVEVVPKSDLRRVVHGKSQPFAKSLLPNFLIRNIDSSNFGYHATTLAEDVK